MPSDPFGRAVLEFHRGEQAGPLRQFDGDDAQDHPIEAYYFDDVDSDSERVAWLESHLDGPLLEVGAGAGRDALYFQDRYETVATDVSGALVELMAERGVADARRADMFALRDAFERDRFRSVFAHGTQLGLAGSLPGVREFLADLAHVTAPEATAVVDNYDPDREATADLLGYRDDATPGMAFRVMHFEYDGDVGDTLLFRLFSPDRLREAVVGTDWSVRAVRYSDDRHYSAALEKS
jgi:hypothetical protein